MRALLLSHMSIVRACLAAVVLVCLAQAGLACPTCKAGLGAHDPAHGDLVSAYMWSILFMMSMPFTLLASFGGYCYWLVRKARAAAQSPATASHDGESHDLVPAGAVGSLEASDAEVVHA
jgi:hypothetical protein